METKLPFRSYDGTSLEGTYASADHTNEAVALLVHGITSARDEFGLFSGLADYLKNEGLSSFRFDYRCHGASEWPMESLTLAGIVNDIEAAATVALVEGKASRLHVIGMSFGGGLSAFWAATTALPVISVVMLAPVIDYEEDVLRQHGALRDGKLTEDAAAALKRQGYLEMDGIRYGPGLLNELRFISGTEGLRRLTRQVLIIHGDADSIVPYASSKRFAQLHAHCQLINIPGTDHGFAVGDDEDLTSPQTKNKHREVFGLISRFLQEASPP
jgi:pimeloyl-ACP methyl ester carboxylesterase